MTDSPDSNNNADDEKPIEDSSDLAANGDASGDQAADNQGVGDVADELPEDEELTPELVEEEAIRGDFMLRWAVIFLAVLFGFSQIADTRTLVHIRSGDQMRTNGILPSSQDRLSYATEGVPVANVSWLFDHVVSAIYSLGGDKALTLCKAVLAGLIAYVLSLISVRGMPTWWSSICCAFAVAACSIDFLPVTDIVTLLGLAITLLWLHRYDEGGDASLVWKLPVMMVLWANMDPRAFMGVLAVLLFAVGAKFRQSKSVNAGDSPGADVSVLWNAAGFSFLALLVNPSPVASLLSPISIYGLEYPGMAAMKPVVGSNGQPTDAATMLDGRTEYFQLWVSEVFNGFELAYIAGLFLIVIAIVVAAIGRDRNNLPWVCSLIGFSLLAAIALHELPAAALVAAATAGVAAQRWYGKTFRQEYSIDTAEVLFSRGGRAVTVFVMALLAFLVVADRLPTRSSVGLGFDPDLAATMAAMEEELAGIPVDDRIMNTRVSQGDLLIWHGRRSFVDSRIIPFGSLNDTSSLLWRFDSLRKSLLIQQQNQSGGGRSTDVPEADLADEDPAKNPNWPEEFMAFQLDHVMLRLAPPGPPAYPLVQAFQVSPAWSLLTRGGASAIFSFVKSDASPSLVTGFDVRQAAFRNQPEDVPSVARLDFGREKDFYSKYIYASRPNMTVAHREAQNYFYLNSRYPAQLIGNVAMAAAQNATDPKYIQELGAALAGPLMTIRKTNTVLLTDPQNAAAHRLQGMAYQQLATSESIITQVLGGSSLSEIRSIQAIMAYRQATSIAPTDSDSWQALIGLYESRNQIDFARECLDKYLELEADAIFDTGPEGEERLLQMQDMRLAWADQSDAIRAQVDDMLASSEQPLDPQQNAQQKFSIAQQLYADGYGRIALDLIRDNIDLLRALPAAEVLHGTILMEAGELEEADQLLNRLAGFVQDQAGRPELAGLQWHQSVALIRLGKADYESAKDAWSDKLTAFREAERNVPQLINLVAQSLPLAASVRPASTVTHWPLAMLQTAQVPVGALQKGAAEPAFMMAMVDLEGGYLNEARRELEKLISEAGETPYRALAVVYLSQLADDAPKVIRSTAVNSWEDFEFPEAAKTDGNESEASGPEKAAETEPTPEKAKQNADDASTADSAPTDPSSTKADAPTTEADSSVDKGDAPTAQADADVSSETQAQPDTKPALDPESSQNPESSTITPEPTVSE